MSRGYAFTTTFCYCLIVRVCEVYEVIEKRINRAQMHIQIHEKAGQRVGSSAAKWTDK